MPTEQNDSDDNLFERFQKGEIEAVGILYGRYSSKIYSYASSRTRGFPEIDPEDVVQTTFTQIIQSKAQFDRSRGSFSAWIYRIAHNLIINLIRRHNPTISIDDDNIDLPLPPLPDPNDIFECAWSRISEVDRVILQRTGRGRKPAPWHAAKDRLAEALEQCRVELFGSQGRA